MKYPQSHKPPLWPKGLLWLCLLCCLFQFTVVSRAMGEIYGFKDEEGYLRFPGVAPVSKRNKGNFDHGRLLATILKYEHLIIDAASHYGIEAPLLKAVIMAESRFQRGAVSQKGALGLMQLTMETARDVGVKNPFNPEQNILGGARYLSHLLKRFNNQKVLAVAAYNAGPGRVEACGGVPPIQETQRFVKRVMEYYRMFKQESGDLP